MAVTDFDERMKATIADTFPDTQQQLCIHHINSNVFLRAKQRWKYETDTSTGEESETHGPPSRTQAQLSLSEEDRLAVKLSATQGKATAESISHDY